ncbi:biogenesis of lysosome-related organelles complex 1 subunit 5-like [Paramuricea clavata]|uniref:Biogenesis of lysosome-related organelles complex 1 subunit 5 n=1 Tax=Paramuricea clavata TaxID=317549 RepID=A0A7D9M4Z8_PARCT|nr:biogenesis of lysosome-related organelles complex 1 subunit 5-like [Paramuricea clavata]
MSAEKLVRDIGDVYSKLFNHQGPIQREVNFYVQEFETKRKDRETSRLNQASVNCAHIETLLPDVENLSKEHVQTVLDRTENALKKANTMLENKLPEEDVEKVEERRTRMEKEWKTFEEKTNSSRELAEQCHIERMEKLKEDIERLDEEIKGK